MIKYMLLEKKTGLVQGEMIVKMEKDKPKFHSNSTWKQNSWSLCL